MQIELTTFHKIGEYVVSRLCPEPSKIKLNLNEELERVNYQKVVDSFKTGQYLFISMYDKIHDSIPSYYWILDVETNKELNWIYREGYLSYEILDVREFEDSPMELLFISCSLTEVFVTKVDLAISNSPVLLASIQINRCLKSQFKFDLSGIYVQDSVWIFETLIENCKASNIVYWKSEGIESDGILLSNMGC